MIKAVNKDPRYMLSGSLWDKILIFAIPLAIGNVVQQLFNSADVAVVGRFAGSDSLAAVGSTSSIINLMLNLLVGLSIGSNVVISKAIGKKDDKLANDAVHTAFLTALISGIIIMIIGIVFAIPILNLISTPEEIIGKATLYLRIYFLGLPFITIYNFEASIMRSVGDTVRPVIILVIAGITNVILNIFFVVVCGLDVAGVAIATTISNIISSMSLMHLLRHEDGVIKLQLKKLSINREILFEIIKIGIPASIQGMVFSFSNVCIQSGLNKLGTKVISASAAALNFEYYAFFVLNSFTQACMTFVGQNFGARNWKRCRKVVRTSLALDIVVTMIVCTIFIIFYRPLMSVFTTDSEIIELGGIRMKYILGFEVLNIIIDLMSGALRGIGKSFVPALICVLGICGTRLIWVYLVFPHFNTLENLMAVYSVSWVVTLIFMSIAYFKTMKKNLRDDAKEMA